MCSDGTCSGSIRIVDAGSGQLRFEVEEVWAGDDVAWSPDGSRIAFVPRIPGDGGPAGQAEIFVTDIETGATHRVTTSPDDDLQPSWNAAGTWLLFSRQISGDRGRIEIWAIHAAGSQAIRVAEDAHGAAWRPVP
jgi:Tol biopolymer transport system component